MEAQVGHPEKLGRVDGVPHRVPEDLALALGALREAACVDVEIGHVERAERAGDDQQIERDGHDPVLRGEPTWRKGRGIRARGRW